MFCGKIFDKTANEYDYLNKIVFSYEATFHLSGKFNRQNVQGYRESTWKLEHVRDSPKLNFFFVL